MHVCCITAFSCYCLTTNATYQLVQVNWFTTVIRFKSEVLPHCSCRVRLWNHFCFYFVKSQLVLPLACYSSRSSHVALCVISGAPPPHTEAKSDWQGFTWETRGKQTSMQMEIIEAHKIIKLIFIYRRINWFIDYHDRPRINSNKCIPLAWTSLKELLIYAFTFAIQQKAACRIHVRCWHHDQFLILVFYLKKLLLTCQKQKDQFKFHVCSLPKAWTWTKWALSKSDQSSKIHVLYHRFTGYDCHFTGLCSLWLHDFHFDDITRAHFQSLLIEFHVNANLWMSIKGWDCTPKDLKLHWMHLRGAHQTYAVTWLEGAIINTKCLNGLFRFFETVNWLYGIISYTVWLFCMLTWVLFNVCTILLMELHTMYIILTLFPSL